jgi:hypothetical protein
MTPREHHRHACSLLELVRGFWELVVALVLLHQSFGADESRWSL